MVGRTVWAHGQPRQECALQNYWKCYVFIERTRGSVTRHRKHFKLAYVEDDVEYLILTPNTLLIGQNLILSDENLEKENKDLGKRFKYIRKCKEAAWLRWIYQVFERTS